MNDGNLNASASAYNASIDVTFGSMYEVDKGLSAAIIASNYDNTQTYSVGDYVVYNRKLYKCITAIDTPEEFDNEKWEQVKLADEVETLSGELVNKADKADTYSKTETDNVVAEAISNLPEVVAGQGISVDDVGGNKQINNTAGIYTVKSTNTTSNTQGEWIGNIDIPDLYNGLTIRYLVTRHTNISGNNNCMLNLTFSDGTESEFVDIMFDKNTFVKNEFQPDDIITLTYFDPAHSPTNDYVWLVQKPTVVQETTNENKALPVLLSETPDDVLKSSNCGAKKNSSFNYNPSTGVLSAPNLSANNVYNKTETNGLLNAKADKTYVDSFIDDVAEELQNKADKSNTYTKSEVDNIISNLPEPMVFKGTLGINGTISVLPAPSDENIGHTYIVITDGVYEGISAKVGDLFISSGTEWVLVPSGDEANDTWRAIKVNGNEVLGSAISSGSVDLVEGDNIEIVFNSTGNKVQISTKNIYTKAEVDEIVNSLLPTDTVSGAICNFDTDLALPLKSYKASIVAQGGGGTPSTPIPIVGFSGANVVHTGGNVWDEDWEVGAYNASGEKSTNASCIRSTNFIPATPNTTYYLKTPTVNGRVCFYRADKSFISRTEAGGNITFTTPNDCRFITFFTAYSGDYAKDISINYPSTDTTYHAYTGTTKTIDFGQTIYGGTITIGDDGKVKLVKTHEVVDLGSLNWFASGEIFYSNTLPLFGQNGKAEINVRNDICDIYKNDTVAVTNPINGRFYVTNSREIPIIRVSDNRFTVAADLKQALQGVKATIQLQAPEEITLEDTEQISAFVGTNNVWSDTGDSEVEYRMSIQEYIDSRTGTSTRSLSAPALTKSVVVEETETPGEEEK